MLTKYDIAARVGLEQLESFSGRMTAAMQRRIFGRNLFGGKTITIDATNQGRVYGKFSVCYGTDWCSFDFSFEEIAELANNPGKAVRF